MFEILNPATVGRINNNINIVRQNRVNLSNPHDSLSLNSLYKFFTETFIQKAINTNPILKNIIKNFNLEMKLNMNELKDLQKNHCKEVQDISKSIVDNLPYSVRLQVDTKSLNEAAFLHDLGKVLIPNSILNKPEKLNFYERTIMDTHSNIGFELLKNSGLSNKTLDLIKNHHKQKNNLTNLFDNKNNNYTLQILSTADKYSALLESRVYKKPLTPQEALTIIYQDVKSGNLDEKVFNALVKYSQSLKTVNYTKV